MTMKKFTVITTFPNLLESYLSDSILARAIKAKKLSVKFVNPRQFATDKHHKTDFRPYGGGPGMVMLAEPILRAVEAVLRTSRRRLPVGEGKSQSTARARSANQPQVIIFSPQGKSFTNQIAAKLAKEKRDIILIAGRYEGIDARVKKILKAEEYSIGDYVLTGGELPAAVVIDAVARQLPGVLGKEESLEEKRVASREVYTRPEVLEWPPSSKTSAGRSKKHRVPKVLLSGHQANITAWRAKRAKRS